MKYLILSLTFVLPLVAYSSTFDKPYHDLPVGPMASSDEEKLNQYLNADGLKVIKYLTPSYQSCLTPKTEHTKKVCKIIAQQAVEKAAEHGYRVSVTYFRSPEYIKAYIKAHDDATQYRELPTASKSRKTKYQQMERQRDRFEEFKALSKGDSSDG